MIRQFVIQEHSRGDTVHWDMMLECGNILKTWRLETPPENIGSEPANATKIFDHDLKFLTYEGTVNKGLGSVRIADGGTFEMLEESEERLCVDLHGKILSGEFTLEHSDRDQWRFSCGTKL